MWKMRTWPAVVPLAPLCSLLSLGSCKTAWLHLRLCCRPGQLYRIKQKSFIWACRSDCFKEMKWFCHGPFCSDMVCMDLHLTQFCLTWRWAGLPVRMLSAAALGSSRMRLTCLIFSQVCQCILPLCTYIHQNRKDKHVMVVVSNVR